MLKVAIVGCGKIADGHIEEIQKLDNARLVAACDLEGLMAEQIAVRYAIPAHYDDFATLLEKETPDVVHVTTPPQSHLPLAKMALDGGCHVYVEKPFTLDRTEALELLEYARSKGKKVTVGHSFEFDPVWDAARKVVVAGGIGDVVHVESFLGYNLSGPFGAVLMGDPGHWVHSLPGRLFHNNLNHVLHKILEYVDADAPRVAALALSRREETFGDVRDDLAEELRVILAGNKITAYATFSSHIKPVRHTARILGTEGSMSLDFGGRTLTYDQAEKLPSAIGRLMPAFAESMGFMREGFKNVWRFMKSDYQFFAGMKALFERFYRCIEDDSDPPIAYDEIIRITAVMDEIFAQVDAQGGRK